MAALAAAVTVRRSAIADLPAIHSLIRQSYAAMNPLTENKMVDFWAQGAEKSITSGDLVEAAFKSEYSDDRGAGFWVALDGDEVVGCVGLKRPSEDDAELVRMSVSESQRGKSVGQVLVRTLEQFAKAERVCRVHLVTANTRAASFYREKCGFLDTQVFTHDAFGVTLTVSKQTRFLGERIIKSVAIVGGTHGNERAGVNLVRLWRSRAQEQEQEQEQKVLVPVAKPYERSTFVTWVVHGNPQACSANRRFMDQDLNRQFLVPATPPPPTSASSAESARAGELLELLGPKSTHRPSAIDFTIDLHSTNSDVGAVIMLASADIDPVALAVAHSVQRDAHAHAQELDIKITTTEGAKADCWSLDSVSRSGLSVEVGPLPHGTVTHEAVSMTTRIVDGILDKLQERNLALLSLCNSNSNSNSSSQHAPDILTPDNSAWRPPTASQPFPLQKVYVCAKTIAFPPPSTAEGFCVVHPSLDKANFRAISHGDAAFIQLPSQDEVPFAHPSYDPCKPQENLKPLFTMFVNEASYAAKDVAFAVYEEKTKPVLLY